MITCSVCSDEILDGGQRAIAVSYKGGLAHSGCARRDSGHIWIDPSPIATWRQEFDRMVAAIRLRRTVE